MHFEVSGAYTGEISAEMLRHLFTNFVILGHSERREYFGETDAIVNNKTLAALDANLKPIVCIGETLDEREAGKVSEVIKTQPEGALIGVTAEAADALVVATSPFGRSAQARQQLRDGRRSARRNPLPPNGTHWGTSCRKSPYSLWRLYEARKRR